MNVNADAQESWKGDTGFSVGSLKHDPGMCRFVQDSRVGSAFLNSKVTGQTELACG